MFSELKIVLIIRLSCLGLTQKIDDDGNPITCNTDSDQMCQVVFQPETFQDLRSKVKQMKSQCGSVCDTSIKSSFMGQYYPQIWKNIDCPAMFQTPLFDRPSEFSPPLKLRQLPKFLKQEFSYNNQVTLKSAYADNTQSKYRFTYSIYLCNLLIVPIIVVFVIFM